MPIPIPDFEGESLNAIRRNVNDVIFDMDAGEENMLEKINTFIQQFQFPEEVVKDKIRNDEIFRARFAKNPGRQGIHEKLAAEFIKKIPTVKNFKILPKNGTNSKQLLGGAVLSKVEVQRLGGTRQSKTIDFEWETRGKKIYASHKYTKDSGGAQDNQYDDIKDFIREANNSNSNNTLFLAISDGAYYHLNDAHLGITKIQNLKNLSNKRNVFALSSVELEDFLNNNPAIIK